MFSIKGASGRFASYSQVREARTLLSDAMLLVLMVFCNFSSVCAIVSVWHDLGCCLDMNCVEYSEDQWRDLLISPKRVSLA